MAVRIIPMTTLLRIHKNPCLVNDCDISFPPVPSLHKHLRCRPTWFFLCSQSCAPRPSCCCAWPWHCACFAEKNILNLWTGVPKHLDPTDASDSRSLKPLATNVQDNVFLVDLVHGPPQRIIFQKGKLLVCWILWLHGFTTLWLQSF